MQPSQRRLYASAIGLMAVLTIGTVFVPWVSLYTLGTPVGWDGIGRTHDAAYAALHVGPRPYGWYVIAAGAVGLLAALTLFVSRPRVTVWALWIAALAALAATAVPIIALADPAWLIGGFIHQITLHPLPGKMGREFLNVPVLGFVIGALVLLAILCIGTALALRPLRWRIRVSIDRTPAARAGADAADGDAGGADADEAATDDDVEPATTGTETTEDEDTEDKAGDDEDEITEPEPADPLAMVIIDKTGGS